MKDSYTFKYYYYDNQQSFPLTTHGGWYVHVNWITYFQGLSILRDETWVVVHVYEKESHFFNLKSLIHMAKKTDIPYPWLQGLLTGFPNQVLLNLEHLTKI